MTIRVTDPTNDDAPYDIKAAGGPFQIGNAALRVDVAFSTRPDFTNTGSGSATIAAGTPAQPISIDFKANGVPDPAYAGAFKATAAVPIPATATGSGSAILEGRPNVRLDTNGDGVLETVAVPVVASGKTLAITDATPVAYRQVVDIAKCNDCHKQLSLHGENRTGNAELCATCHNPNATDINRRVAGSNCEIVTGTLDDQTIDFKVMVHAIHAGAIADYKVCGFGNTGYDFSRVRYPGKLDNCGQRDATCRTPTTRPTRLLRSQRRPTPRLPRAPIARRPWVTSRPLPPPPSARPATRARTRATAHDLGRRGRFGYRDQGCEQPDTEHTARGLRDVPRAGQGCGRQESARRRRVQFQLRRI